MQALIFKMLHFNPGSYYEDCVRAAPQSVFSVK